MGTSDGLVMWPLITRFGGETVDEMKSHKRTKEQLIHKIRQVLIDTLTDDLAAVVLYGSVATGQEDEYSDIDLLIVVQRQFHDWRVRQRLEVELRKRFY